MKITSFIKEGHEIVPIEVELSLNAGLPRVEFTGMADISIKECITRIKLAFFAQNFKWPKKSQITINLRPAYIKKNSQGLDLAIAYALLLQTKQIHKISSLGERNHYVYGEVTLNGNIEAPSDVDQIDKNPLLTGFPKTNESLNEMYCVRSLRELQSPTLVKPTPLKEMIKKPELPNIDFSKNSARLLEIICSGEHHTLMAGESGSGKTTLAHHIPYLLTDPPEDSFKVSRRILKNFGENLSWRSFISPHHSTPPLSMIGGGFPPFLGEISKAHGGVLFLDEYLEFQSKVQESLREPIEQGRIFISRKGESLSFPSNFLLIGATNLCPCGNYVPGKEYYCSYSLRRCRSRLEKLNGPMLDRFDILCFSTFWKGPLTVPLTEIENCIQKAVEFRKKRKQTKPNGKLNWNEIKERTPRFILENLLPKDTTSQRRRLSLLRVARTLADLEEVEELTPSHIEQSTHFTLRPFNQIILDA